MRQVEIEKLAFLYLCEEKDRNILDKKEKMTFKDFERFDFLTRKLELWECNKWIWKEFSADFTEKNCAFSGVEWELEEEIKEQKIWWEAFLKTKELLDSGSNY